MAHHQSRLGRWPQNRLIRTKPTTEKIQEFNAAGSTASTRLWFAELEPRWSAAQMVTLAEIIEGRARSGVDPMAPEVLRSRLLKKHLLH